jgi:hypothetical protein
MPTDKVAAGALAGTFTTLIVGILALSGIVLDPALVSAAVTLIYFAAAWIKTETNHAGGSGNTDSN